MNEMDIISGIFAHPDDMELTVGGTLLKMKSLGYKTGALDITQGEMGTRGTCEGRAERSRRRGENLKVRYAGKSRTARRTRFCDRRIERTKMVRILRAFETESYLDASDWTIRIPTIIILRTLCAKRRGFLRCKNYDGDFGQETNKCADGRAQYFFAERRAVVYR